MRIILDFSSYCFNYRYDYNFGYYFAGKNRARQDDRNEDNPHFWELLRVELVCVMMILV